MKPIFNGHKTYLAGILAILVGILGQIFGWFAIEFNIGLILSGFATIGVGHKLVKATDVEEKK